MLTHRSSSILLRQRESCLLYLQGRRSQVRLRKEVLNYGVGVACRKHTTYLVNGELREQRLCLLVGNGGVNDNIVALLPVNRRSNTVLVTNLQGCICKVRSVWVLHNDFSERNAQSTTLQRRSRMLVNCCGRSK